MSAAINLARLAKGIGSLRDPAVQQLIPVLGAHDDTLRAVAAVALEALGATEAIPAIRQALANTGDDHMKTVIQERLDRLIEIQKGSK
jgi:HEAT repeat protein